MFGVDDGRGGSKSFSAEMNVSEVESVNGTMRFEEVDGAEASGSGTCPDRGRFLDFLGLGCTSGGVLAGS